MIAALAAWLLFGVLPHHAAIACEAAARHGVRCADVVAMLAAEASHPESVGSAGERGLLQLWDGWRRAYNREHGTRYTRAGLHDVATNIEIGAWAIAQMQHKHARVCNARSGTGPGTAEHTWAAHYQCASSARGTDACDTSYRDWLVARARRHL